MSIVQKTNPDQSIIEQVLVMGDLSRLSPEQRNVYYKQVCESVGLNPLTRPFEFIVLNGKLTLYARKDCTDQLRKLNGVSIRIVSRETIDGVVVVTAQATDRTGRVDESTGAVSTANLRGEALSNAWMKAETKSKRRVTLSICGLGFTDESELEGVVAQKFVEPPTASAYASDRIVAAAKALPAPSTPSTPSTPAAPAAAKPDPQPSAESKPEADGDGGFLVIDVATIEEHKAPKSGAPVWKITTGSGETYAVTDALVVSDIADARSAERAIRVEWQRRGSRRLILSAQGVAE